MPKSTNEGMISKNITAIMIFVCLRTKSNMREFSSNINKKGEHAARLYLGGWWVLTGSNRRHSACKADALPTELSTRLKPAISSVHLSTLYLDEILELSPL